MSELSILQLQVAALNLDLYSLDRGILPEDARAEREQSLRLAATNSLPEELRQQAQNMSVGEIDVLRIEFEREQCE